VKVYRYHAVYQNRVNNVLYQTVEKDISLAVVSAMVWLLRVGMIRIQDDAPDLWITHGCRIYGNLCKVVL
jgi:hypothetical protein